MYTCITVGCPSAYSLKYKHGGLARLQASIPRLSIGGSFTPSTENKPFRVKQLLSKEHYYDTPTYPFDTPTYPLDTPTYPLDTPTYPLDTLTCLLTYPYLVTSAYHLLTVTTISIHLYHVFILLCI